MWSPNGDHLTGKSYLSAPHIHCSKWQTADEACAGPKVWRITFCPAGHNGDKRHYFSGGWGDLRRHLGIQPGDWFQLEPLSRDPWRLRISRVRGPSSVSPSVHKSLCPQFATSSPLQDCVLRAPPHCLAKLCLLAIGVVPLSLPGRCPAATALSCCTGVLILGPACLVDRGSYG